MNLIDEARMDFCAERCELARQRGWLIARDQTLHGVRFRARRGDVTVKGERKHAPDLALMSLLHELTDESGALK